MNNLKRFSVGIIVLCAVGSLAQTPPGNPNPTAPSSASDQQIQANDLTGKRGHEQVDLFTGAFKYSIPISCAPARNGSEPNLALTYCSGDENGWCGMGWKLDIGYIERNTKDGFPMKYSAASPPAPMNQYDDSKGFMLNLFGKEYKLLPTATANEYDAEVDTDFLHCVLDTTNNRWLVYDKSGNIYYFGSATDGSSKMSNTKTGWSGNSTATFRWALDQIVTATGDWTAINYTTYTSPYTSVSEKTLYPTQITYNGHTNNNYSAQVGGANKIIFQTELRPNDWHFSYRAGFRMEFDRRLTNILCQVGSQNVWNYRLRYGISPATDRSVLTNVIVSGFDANNNASVLLTNSFAYQGSPVSFGSTITWTNLTLISPDGGSYAPYVTKDTTPDNYASADLVDIDGDGLPDRVVYDNTTVPNQYQVQRNLGMQANGAGAFGNRFAFGPTSTGGIGSPSISNPIPGTTFWASLNSPEVRLRDINGDGLPDRICDYWSYWANGNNPAYYTNFDVMLNTGSGFASFVGWTNINPGPGTAIAGSDATLFDCIESGGVNAGFFDINGDGLPDRVLSTYYSQGPMTNFLVQFNTGTNFSVAKQFGPYFSQNWNTNPNSYYWAGLENLGSPNYSHMVDINGDGLPDRVMLPINPSSPINPVANTARTYFAVEYDNGYAFEAVNTSTAIGGRADQWLGVNPQISGNADYAEIQNLPYVGLYDMNGDGLPDRVMLNDTNFATTPKSWLVYLNNGHGFDANPIVVTNIDAQGQYSDAGWWGIQSSYYGSTVVTLMDINGDGLLDRVMDDYNNTIDHYYYGFKVQLNKGPSPDLLTNVNNGIGGNVAVKYLPSTAYPNYRDPNNPNGGSLMPFPKQTVAAVIESDGINPSRTNSYGYLGGFYDGVRREFHGFAMVTVTNPPEPIAASFNRRTVHYFHQGGGQSRTNLGEYLDPGNFAKVGMEFRSETYGNDNNLYHVTVNQVNQASLGYGRYFPFVQTTFDCDSGNGTTNRVTTTQFVYDPATGNLTNKIVYGEVSGFNPANVGNFSFTDNAADTKYYNTHFTTIGTYIVDHPDKATLTDGNNNIIRETDYTYNSGSGTLSTKLTRISAGYYATNSYGNYNSYGLVGQTTDPVGVVTTITYDSTYTYPATTTVGGSFTTTTSYDARSGLVTGVTDPMGVTVTNTYDAFQRLKESDKIPVSGSAIWMKKVGYNLGVISAGAAASYIAETNNDGVGGVEIRTYIDGLGRPVQTRTQGENGNYRVVSTAYDARGEAFLTTWPIFGSSASFSKPSTGQTATWIGYDAPGRVATNRPVSVTFDGNGAFSSKTDSAGDAGTSPLAARTWSYVNGSDPWWKISTDEDGKVRRYQLDAFGRNKVIQEVDGANTYNTTLNYDLAGNLTNIVNANSENIYYAYNDAGGLVAMADPYLGQWTYLRDYAGRLRVQTDARGDVVSNSYINPATSQQDPLGRLQVQTVYSLNYSNHVLVPAFTNTYVYDSNGGDSAYTVYPGLLYKVTDSEGWEKNGYDNRGRLTNTTRYLNINGKSYTNSYTFNDGDKITSITYPNSGPTITNSYFTGGSLKQVANSASFSGNNYYTVSAANIDEFGHVTSFAYGNSLTTTRSYYSTSKRLQTISVGSVFSRTYQYTAGEDISFINGTGVTNVSVTYDNLHRVKTFTGLTGSYGYDSVGNITNSIEGGGSTYSYANPRKQAVRTAFGYTNLYDLCGNMIVRHGGLTNSQAMVYDADNRLKIFSQAGKVVVEYGYAADGARLWKRTDQSATNVQVWIGRTYEEKGGKTLFHVFADGQQVCTFETNSALGGGSGTSTNVVGYYYHEDNLNSSSALSYGAGSQMGQQAEVNAYYPFGRTLTASPQASFQVSRRFTGQVFDGETGFYFFATPGEYGRPYDPELDRFMQADDRIPDLSNPQSYNRYSYCVNNPLRYTDPDGHYGLDAMSGLTVEQQIITSQHAAPIVLGMTAATLTGGAATPLLVSAGASTTFAAIGSGMIAGAAGDLTSQALTPGKSFSGQELAVSTLAGGALNGVASKVLGGTPEPTPAGNQLPVKYNPDFAELQKNGQLVPSVTPEGRVVTDHAANRILNGGPGRQPMSITDVDKVLNEGNAIKKVNVSNPKGPTVTVQNTQMPGKPQVTVDAGTGKRVVTVIQPKTGQ